MVGWGEMPETVRPACGGGGGAGRLLEVHDDAEVELPTGEVVGHGPLLAVHVVHPIHGVFILVIQQVEHFEVEPDAFEVFEEWAAHELVLAADEAPRGAKVDAVVGAQAAHGAVFHAAGHAEGQPVAEDEAQLHLVLGVRGPVVLEQQREGVAHLVGAGHPAVRHLLGAGEVALVVVGVAGVGAAVHDFLARAHERQVDPRVGAGHELAEELEVHPGGVGHGVVAA